jgi:predicted PurR-regulated permease PerM
MDERRSRAVSSSPETLKEKEFVGRALEATIRVGVVLVLVLWCFQIVRPFVVPAIWGAIIAVATHGAYLRLERLLGGRRAVAATLFTLVMLVVLVVPVAMLSDTLVASAGTLARDLREGVVAIPPPPESVAGWPIIGKPLARIWSLASVNLEAALTEVQPQLRAVGLWLLSAATGTALGVLQFVVAILVAGVLLAYADGAGRTALAIARRLAGESGAELAGLARATVRSVAIGILGIALVQALLAGLGFLAVGIPGAGFLAFLCLLLAVIQIGANVILVPTVIYVFSTADTLTAVAFLAWCVVVGLMDNVLKPLVLGRGINVPVLVIPIGAIGGFIASGIIGLFIGAVVLALGYTLFMAWLHPDAPAAEAAARGVPPGSS